MATNASVSRSAENSAFATYTFQKKVMNAIMAHKTQSESYSARVLGLHVENVLVDALNRHPLSKGKKVAIPNPWATKSLMSTEAGRKAIVAADAAAQQAVKLTVDFIKQKLQELDAKNYTVSLTDNLGTSLAGGSLVGDMAIVINGYRIVLESKFSSSPSASAIVRWAGLKSSTLFGDDAFKYYLVSKSLWRNTLRDFNWIPEVQEALESFLVQSVGGAEDQVLFFLQKGKAIPQNSFDSKYVIHTMGQTTKVQATLTSMDELETQLKAATQTGKHGFYSLTARGFRESISYETPEGEILAQAAVTEKTVDDFNIEFYIAQKLINASAVAQFRAKR